MEHDPWTFLAPYALPQNPASHTERMQQIVQNYVDIKSFMVAVLVTEENRVLLNRGYGYADLEWRIANSPVYQVSHWFTYEAVHRCQCSPAARTWKAED